tara:strand:+ start:544 stop:834 length:291 start_codon:yes stop_codon:yes gene_type:complete
MGRRLVVTFIYSGIAEWYLRIPLIKRVVDLPYTPDDFYTEYLPKDTYTFRDAINRRKEVVKHLEESGKRNPISKTAVTYNKILNQDHTQLFKDYNC